MNRKDILNDLSIGNKAEAYEAFDDIPTNPNLSRTIGEVVAARYSRRDLFKGALAVTTTTALFGTSAMVAPKGAAAAATSRYNFSELEWGNDEMHHVAEGYDADILLRWGDPITADAPDFDVMNQTAEAQLQQFGYNKDYVGFTALNDAGTRGLLCVNHEYTNEEVMFPALGRQARDGFKGMTPELIDIEMAAHGGTVVEIEKETTGQWRVERAGKYNRRITPLNTAVTIDGPAAGHPRMQTNADPEGMTVIGTLNNCAGGMTPWGTYLMAEENFHGYFWSDTLDADGRPDLSAQPEAHQMKRYGVPRRWYNWGTRHDRFNIDKEPNESNRFGWIVEVDPRDPEAMPVKHTALGRFRHEGAETTLAADGRLVIYSGDDNRFDYQYKYVSRGVVSADKAANSKLLSDGTLYVARFDEDGTVSWLPLIHGQGPLTAENGFNDQGDVMIDTRLAADLLGATPMDRPEDAQPRGDGPVYLMSPTTPSASLIRSMPPTPAPRAPLAISSRSRRQAGITARPQGHGRSLCNAVTLRRLKRALSGTPRRPRTAGSARPTMLPLTRTGGFGFLPIRDATGVRRANPTGFMPSRPRAIRGTSKLFFRCPVGGEMCGPYFTDDQETLFLAVQHPGTDGTKDLAGFERDSTFEDPATLWPDFDPAMPPRPAVVVVTKQGGGKIAV